jgi:ATP-binding cassette, subfamily B, bacterial PglK
MLLTIKTLLEIMSPEHKLKVLKLQILTVVAAILELTTIITVAPFIVLMSSGQKIEQSIIGKYFILIFGEINSFYMTTIISLGLAFILFTSSIFSIITIWKLALFANHLGAAIGQKIFLNHIEIDWGDYINVSSSDLTKTISTEVQRLTVSILQPLFNLNAKIIVAASICIGLLIYNPIVACLGLAIFSMTYYLIFKVVRTRLSHNGKRISLQQSLRFKLMQTTFGGMKNLRLSGQTAHALNEFDTSGENLANAMGANAALIQTPRYFIETVAIGSVLIAFAVLSLTEPQGAQNILPALSIYAMAAFKLLPAFQQIYTGIASVTGNASALHAIRDRLQVQKNSTEFLVRDDQPELKLQIDNNYSSQPPYIEARNVSFSYNGTALKSINDVSFSIRKNESIGIVGPSGSGKSTLVDLISALLQPTDGDLLYNGHIMSGEAAVNHQRTIGYVPQYVFLADDTIAQNIAFGVAPEKIDHEHVKHVASLAELSQTISQMPNGLGTNVGDLGSKISGGQRQRIGIARALYGNPDLLIFDEATSALDGITERHILNSIKTLGKEKSTITIAHRLNTIKHCDRILVLNAGEIVAQGTFNQLLEKNELFQQMAAGAT